MNLFTPVLPLALCLLGGLIWEIISPRSENKRLLFWLQALGCLLGIFILIYARPATLPWFQTILGQNAFSAYFQILFLALGFLTFVLCDQYLLRMRQSWSSELPLLLGVIFAALYLLTLANDLILIWVLFELVSVTLYFCVGFFKNENSAREAALKYFTLGVFASAFLTLGLALLYAFTGSFSLSVIAAILGSLPAVPQALSLAVFLIVLGLGFKLAVIPMHLWVPDVYAGAFTALTAMMATAIKAMALYLLAAIVFTVLAPVAKSWDVLFQGLAFATLLGGSLLALTQSEFKRLMAYSSIVNAGYLLVGLLTLGTGSASAWAALAFFMISYCAATFLMFYAMAVLETGLGTRIADYRGLWRRSPFLALAIAVSLLSLAGFPFLAGFMAKVYLFLQVVAAGKTGLVFCALGVTVVSLYYYLMPLVEIFLKEPAASTPLPRVGFVAGGVMTLLVLFLVLGGIWISPLLQLLAAVTFLI